MKNVQELPIPLKFNKKLLRKLQTTTSLFTLMHRMRMKRGTNNMGLSPRKFVRVRAIILPQEQEKSQARVANFLPQANNAPSGVELMGDVYIHIYGGWLSPLSLYLRSYVYTRSVSISLLISSSPRRWLHVHTSMQVENVSISEYNKDKRWV